MQTNVYRGKVLHLVYPHFLRIQEKEPNWWALGRKGTTVQVHIDPPQQLASIFAESIRNPYFARSPGVFIEREGAFKSATIEGYERLARLALPNSSVGSRSWNIEGKLRNRNLVNIKIDAVEGDWHDGTIWAAFIDSIEVVGAVAPEEWFPDAPSTAKRAEPAVRSPGAKNTGILLELPKGLDYLLELAMEVQSLCQENLEENPDLPKLLERHLSNEMRGLTKEKAKSRVKVDRERLWEWLKKYPAERFPETAGLHVVGGALLYADGIFE